jgi:hypothetical protein
LEEAAKKIASQLKRDVKEIIIIPNTPTTLRDGTPAYESIIEFKSVGNNKVKSTHISVFKDEKWIRVSLFTGVKYFNENFKKIVLSLEFNT